MTLGVTVDTKQTPDYTGPYLQQAGLCLDSVSKKRTVFMFEVTVMTPHVQGKTFDFEYYHNTHMPLVKQRPGHGSLVRTEEAKGISGPVPCPQAPYLVIAELLFESLDAVHNTFMKHGHELMGDVPNYTNIQPQIQISEII